MDNRQLDRFADRLLEMVVAQQQQAAALERIAVAVEAMVKAAQAEPVELTLPQTWGGPVTGLPEHGNGV